MNISLMLNTVNTLVLSYKSRSLFLVLFHSWPENQSASLPYSWVTPPWWQHWHTNKHPGGRDGLKPAAT